MHRTIRVVRNVFMAGLFLASLAPTVVRADEPAPMPAGFRADMIANIDDTAGKVEELAAAVPESKYGWAPAKGVRTAGQVYLHIVAANYMLPGVVGVAGGMSMDEGMKLDQTTQTKAKTLEMLKDSYAFLDKAIADMSDADMDAQVDFFGKKMSKRAVLLAALAHSHEHLGQSIAYARSMGITPPWTARQNAAAQPKMAGDKPGMHK